MSSIKPNRAECVKPEGASRARKSSQQFNAPPFTADELRELFAWMWARAYHECDGDHGRALRYYAKLLCDPKAMPDSPDLFRRWADPATHAYYFTVQTASPSRRVSPIRARKLMRCLLEELIPQGADGSVFQRTLSWGQLAKLAGDTSGPTAKRFGWALNGSRTHQGETFPVPFVRVDYDPKPGWHRAQGIKWTERRYTFELVRDPVAFMWARDKSRAASADNDGDGDNGRQTPGDRPALRVVGGAGHIYEDGEVEREAAQLFFPPTATHRPSVRLPLPPSVRLPVPPVVASVAAESVNPAGRTDEADRYKAIAQLKQARAEIQARIKEAGRKELAALSWQAARVDPGMPGGSVELYEAAVAEYKQREAVLVGPIRAELEQNGEQLKALGALVS